jgi:hypothetical protein
VSHITLPRAVVEQVRETLEKSAVRFFSLAAYISPIESVNGVKPSRGREDVIAALVALDAALEAQEDEALLNEPVAMRYDGDGYGYLYIDSGSGSDWQRRHKDAEPLYLAPPEPDAKREPATVEQIDEEYIGPVIDARWHDFEAGFRAAERFHGIRGSK